MSTKECPSCAMEVDAKAKDCPICGYEFPAFNGVFKVVALVLVVALLLLFLYRYL